MPPTLPKYFRSRRVAGWSDRPRRHSRLPHLTHCDETGVRLSDAD
jgi:hypothetical protein